MSLCPVGRTYNPDHPTCTLEDSLMIFFIEGHPVAQGRPKFFRRGNHVGAYDPAKSKDWKSWVKMVATSKGVKPLSGPVSLSLTFQFTRPVSVSAKKRPHHTVKPDLDNCIKGIKDALKGIAWIDDSQVCQIDASKVYADSPGVRVAISGVQH